MKLLLDSANLTDVEGALTRRHIAGITTNPSLLSKEPKAILYIARAEALCGLGKFAEARQALDTAAEKYDLNPSEKAYRAEVFAKIVEAEKGK